jgi:hypothetical protein
MQVARIFGREQEPRDSHRRSVTNPYLPQATTTTANQEQKSNNNNNNNKSKSKSKSNFFF